MEKYTDLLNSCKYKIRQWEVEFAKQHNDVKPTRNDIKVAPEPIRDAYKTYYKIKKKQEALEVGKTLSERDQNSQHEKTSLEQNENKPQSQKADPTMDIPEDIYQEVWGKRQREQEVVETKVEDIKKSQQPELVYSSISNKLMQGAKISIRKSLSKQSLNRSQSSSNIESQVLEPTTAPRDVSAKVDGTDSFDVFEGTPLKKVNFRENYLVTKTQTLSLATAYSDEGGLVMKPTRNYDKAWIDRCSHEFQPAQTCLHNEPDTPVEPHTKVPPEVKTPPPVAPLPTVQPLLEVPLARLHQESQTVPQTKEVPPANYSKTPEQASIPTVPTAPKTPIDSYSFDEAEAMDGSDSKVKSKRSSCKRKRVVDDEEDGDKESCKPARKQRISRVTSKTKNIKTTTKSPIPKPENEVWTDLVQTACKKRQVPRGIQRPVLSDKEKLEKKAESGTVNQNFVMINLKKKVFARGKRGKTGAYHKREEWKLRTGKNPKSGARTILRCQRCGDIGHYAKHCAASTLLPADEEMDDMTLPTLEEAAAMATGFPMSTATPSTETVTLMPSEPTPSLSQEEEEDAILASLPLPGEWPMNSASKPAVDPLYQVNPDGSLIDTPEEVYEMLRNFGHSQFRPGQERAVMRILSGLSTLVVQSTGAGKSLCYQLPAMLYAAKTSCLTLVVSPLVSLMDDQVSNLPPFVRAVCLHTNQNATTRQKAVQTLQDGKAHILLVSPEAIVAGWGGKLGFAALLRNLPPIAFACIDEAHCISQWSHNFRPSYLRVCRVLKEKLGVQVILGLTATAPNATLQSVAANLGLPMEDSQAIVKGAVLPDNLLLSVSADANRDSALLELLKGKRFADSDSIIIYCTRRQECDRLAALIRAGLQELKKDGDAAVAKQGQRRKGLSWNAEAYHAGLTAARRASIQKEFMLGKIRIVIATIAFGMGINKADIRAVIHYNLPRNFESYVQEIGRAGRDGQPAHCHVFLNCEGKDLNELRRFTFSNSLDRSTIRKLLQKVLPNCGCQEQGKACPGHEGALIVEEAVRTLDIPEENIHTLLCQLESHSDHLIRVESSIYATVTLRSYSGAAQLAMAARKCAALAAALALYAEKGKPVTELTFPVVDLSAKMGWESSIVKRELKNLEWDSSALQSGGRVKKTGLIVELHDLAFHWYTKPNLQPEDRDAALDWLYQRCVDRETTELAQLQRLHQAFFSAAHPDCYDCRDDIDQDKHSKLKEFVVDYFNSHSSAAQIDVAVPTVIPYESAVRGDIRNLIYAYPDESFTGRAIARIFHGIGSPCYPVEMWGRQRRFWRAHLDKDFPTICKLATQELLACKLP